MLLDAKRPDMVERACPRNEDAGIIVGECQRRQRGLPFEGDERAGERDHGDDDEDQKRRVDAREAALEELFQRKAFDEQDLAHQPA